jgi:nucleoside-diphosphate-sugar epimerase
MNPVALVVGVTGVTGTPLAEQLLVQGWRVYGISRRPPVLKTGTSLKHFVHIPLDLQDASAVAALTTQCPDVSYVFYCAHDGSGDRRVRMIANLLNAMADMPHVANINLMQGMKYYGSNIGPFKTPAKEADPRVAGCKFYYNEEDLVLRRQREAGWTWTAFRPHAVCGYAAGSPLNLATILGIYGTIMRETGKNFSFPGSLACFNTLFQLVDAELLARACIHVSTTPGCGNQAYNVNNGDIFRWRHMWPGLARFFGLQVGRPADAPLPHFLAQRQSTWNSIATKNNLKSFPIELASRWAKGDYTGHNSRLACEHDIIADTLRLRRAGFNEVMDSEEMFIRMFERLRIEKIIP